MLNGYRNKSVKSFRAQIMKKIPYHAVVHSERCLIGTTNTFCQKHLQHTEDLWLRSWAPCGSVRLSKAQFTDPTELGPTHIVPACFIQTSVASKGRPGKELRAERQAVLCSPCLPLPLLSLPDTSLSFIFPLHSQCCLCDSCRISAPMFTVCSNHYRLDCVCMDMH